MPEFHIAYDTRAAPAGRPDAVVDGRLSHHTDALRMIALVRSPENLDQRGVPLPLPPWPGPLEAQLDAAGFDLILRVVLDPFRLTLTHAAQPGVLHYLRLADATLIPLPPAHPPSRHALMAERPQSQGGPLELARGDAYIAVSPGMARRVDSPALARFLHLRDYFNADKLAAAILNLADAAAPEPLPEAVTVLVIEAR